MEKQWYSFMLWGRLAYDPSLSDALFERALAARHPKASSPHVFRALQGAAQVMPLITRFFWGDIDLKWYPEACWSHRRSKGQGLCAISWMVSPCRERTCCASDMQTTPLEIADALDGAVAATFAALDRFRDAASEDADRRKTVNECESLVWLGRSYASKIRGACALALFDVNGDKFEQEAALRHLGDAHSHWKQYAAIRDAHYVPALYNRVGYVDVTALTEKVAADLEIARNWGPGTLKDDGRRSGSEKSFRE